MDKPTAVPMAGRPALFQQPPYGRLPGAGIVIGIRIYEGSDLGFDKSGLGVSDTAAAYAKAYSWETTPTVPTDAAANFSSHINFRKANTCVWTEFRTAFHLMTFNVMTALE